MIPPVGRRAALGMTYLFLIIVIEYVDHMLGGTP